MNADRITTIAGLSAALLQTAACHNIFPQFCTPAAAIATAVWAFYTNHQLPPSVDRRRPPVDPSEGVR